MIRNYRKEDEDIVMDIWYKSSSLAHPFLENSFVEKVKSDMREKYLPNSETWVYEEKNSVVGFIAMIDNEIGGLFILPEYHSKGIGTKLVDYVLQDNDVLEVEVFERNLIGRSFYDKYGFVMFKKLNHEETGNEILRLIFKPQIN